MTLKASEIKQKLRDGFSEEVKKAMNQARKIIYKELWRENPEKDALINTPLDTSIIVSNGRVSFDNRKTFIHRSEENLIRENLDIYEKKVLDFMVEREFSNLPNFIMKDIVDDYQVNEGGAEKTRVEEDFNDIANELKGILKNIPNDTKKNMVETMTILMELETINEQIDLLREMGGNSKKILSLLEQKHALIKELKKYTD